ncbi:MAG: nucleotidyltransferase domain-containing protein [Myxococcales bacterium]|nr:nucleotidyltransferase domain-containing protein [Myxococcales bacterium]
MSDDAEALETIATRLTERYGCHAAVLYGSRARGDATPASDWDVAAFCDTPGEQWDAVRLPAGLLLDAFVYGPETLGAPGDAMLRLRGGRVLFDRRGVLDALLARLDARYAEGPEPLSPETRAGLSLWHDKTLARIALDDDEGRYRRVRLLADALENYLRLRGRWFEGSKHAWRWLEREAPADLAVFRRALTPGAGLDALADLAEVIAGPSLSRRSSP